MSNHKSFTDFPIGTKIEMTVTDPIDGKLDIGFVSQIEGYIGEKTVRISAPIYEAKIYPVKVNSHIEAYLFYKSNQIYKMEGFVTDRLVVDDIALLDVSVTEDIAKIQRRQFYRFDCSAPVIFRNEPPEAEEAEAAVIEGQTIDISGGGLSAKTDVPLEQDTLIKGWLEFEDNKVDFGGKIIRCSKKIINGELQYISSISFVNIGYKEREKIIGFIFNQQRLLLNKGLRGNE